VARHPSHRVNVAHYPTGDKGVTPCYLDMELGQYIKLLRDLPEERSRYFLTDRSVTEAFPNAAADLKAPSVLSGFEMSRVSAFVGIDTFTETHYHTAPIEAMLTQLHGRKQVVLYGPECFAALKPYPWYSMKFNYSRIPRSSWAAAGGIPDAMGNVCTLEPGEMLFIPQGWFHAVTGFSENVSITYFFKGQYRSARLPVLVRDWASMLHKQLVVMPLMSLARDPHGARLLLRIGVLLGIIPKSELGVWQGRLGIGDGARR